VAHNGFRDYVPSLGRYLEPDPIGVAGGNYTSYVANDPGYRARFYNSQTGRFISEDPIGFESGRNRYAYANNSPVRYVDPLGLRASDDFYIDPFTGTVYPRDSGPRAPLESSADIFFDVYLETYLALAGFAVLPFGETAEICVYSADVGYDYYRFHKNPSSSFLLDYVIDSLKTLHGNAGLAVKIGDFIRRLRH
jgi:hypothetical protein